MFKKSVAIRVRQVVRSFLTKIKDHKYVFSTYYFSQLIEWQRLVTDKSVLRNIVTCCENRNQSKTFCDDNLISKNFRKLSLVEPLFN